MELNSHQERAVAAVGHCTILACPGSGKTRVLSERAARILTSNEKGRLCAVTFTRDAAGELKNRILAACGSVAARRLAVGTFHSMALNQLKRLGAGGKPKRLLSEGERLAVVRRCLAQHSLQVSFDGVMKAIDAAKSKVVVPVFSDQDVETAFTAYQETLAAEDAMDFSDIVLLAVRKMRSGEMPHLPVRWLLVDEAQDMDEVQMEWIAIHGRAGIEVTMVGDDDQSLYAFRHAMGYSGLRGITEILMSTETTLPVNYRCAPNILDHAARLIAHNVDRAPKRIEAHRLSVGEIQVIRAADRWDEGDRLTARLRLAKDAQWAVLGRTNTILDSAEVCLSAAGIACRRSGGKSVWDRPLGSTFLGLLRSVVDGARTGIANALAFCGVPAAYLGDQVNHGSSHCLSYLGRIADRVGADSEHRRIAVGLLSGLASWGEQESKGRSTLVVHGAAAWLSQYCKPDHAEILKNLALAIARLPGSLNQRLAILSGGARQRKDHAVEIMTLHASKGLEFDNVWIVGVEDGNLPHVDSTEAEERRLLYVGMTRARDCLILSGAIEEGPQSRFIGEAGLT